MCSSDLAPDVVRVNDGGKHDVFQDVKATATFKAAGEYVLRAQVNDKSGDGGGGEQCCWTNALVKVIAK